MTKSYDSLTDQLLIFANIIIGLAGLIGNVFVIIVIFGFTSMHKELTNLFVINQSIIDALSSLLVIAQMVSQTRPSPTLSPNEFASEFYCRVWYTQLLLWATYVSSTYNLVAVTMERYMKIVYPFIYLTSFNSQRAKTLLTLVWLFGAFFELYLIPSSAVVGTSCAAEAMWPDNITHLLVGCLIIVIQYWLPLMVFIGAYTKMIRTLRQVNVDLGLGETF